MNSLVPSTSTSGSGLGGFAAVLIVYGFHLKGIDFPAGIEAAIAGIITILGGYIPRSGRRVK